MLKLTENEIIIKTFRKHWFLPLMQTFVVSLLFVAPIIALLVLLDRTVVTEYFELTFALQKPSIAVFVLSIWGLFLWLRFFNFWTDHNLDGWILTNKRVIDVEQRGFFRREVASFRLERLQDVTTEVHGIIATFFNFGDVHVQTAGTDREFVLRHAAAPTIVKETILKEHDRVVDQNVYHDMDSAGSPK